MSDDLLKFSCPECGQNLQIEAAAAGEVIECPSCGIALEIPGLPEDASPPARTPGGKLTIHKPAAPSTRINSPSLNRKRSSASAPSRGRSSASGRRRTAPPPRRKKESPVGWIVLFVCLIGAIGGGVFWAINRQSATTAATSSSTGSGTSSTGGGIKAMFGGSSTSPSLSKTKGWALDQPARVEAFQFGSSGEANEEITAMVARPDGRLVVTGLLSSASSPPSANATHRLIDSRPGADHAFVAELSPDASSINWISMFGGDLLHPIAIALGPDGSIALGGKIRDRLTSVASRDVGSFDGRTSIVVKLPADGSRVEWMREGGPNQSSVNSLVVDPQGRILFSGGTRGRGQTSYIMRLNANGSASQFPRQPVEREWAIDFHVKASPFLESDQIGAFYELDSKHGGTYDYDGPGGWGETWIKPYGMRQGINLLLMPNGDIVASGTLQYDFRVKPHKSFPAFDTIVARWTPDGELLWSSNLYQEGDGVHTPDQKDKDIILNPVNGDLYVAVAQHGSNVYRFKGHLGGDTGNLFISWIGRVDANTGALKDGWYWQNSRNTGYNSQGVPQSPPYPQLAGNSAAELGVDGQGNIYFAGNSGAKAFSTPHAWKKWPSGMTGGGNASLTVLSPDLKKVLYATQIRGSEHAKSRANSMIVTPQGVWVGGRNGGSGFANASAPWSRSSVSGKNDAMLTRFSFD